MMKRLNYLNDYLTETTDVEKELEYARIQREVAHATLGHPYLHAILTEQPNEQGEGAAAEVHTGPSSLAICKIVP